MAQGFLQRCLSCGLESDRFFLVSGGKCRCCATFQDDFDMHNPMAPAPTWTATPRPKLEVPTGLWWEFRKTKWIVLSPFEYPNQCLPWLKK